MYSIGSRNNKTSSCTIIKGVREQYMFGIKGIWEQYMLLRI